MNVLILSPYPDRLAGAWTADDALVSRTGAADMIVSYGHRHILPPETVNAIPCVNLHIGLLPWNRGADPNLWSWIDGTPKGVTIHLMDEGIDTGPILLQREVSFFGDETLATSYERLCADVEALFISYWPLIRERRIIPKPQGVGGSYHKRAHADAIRAELFNPIDGKGWATPVAEIMAWSKS